MMGGVERNWLVLGYDMPGRDILHLHRSVHKHRRIVVDPATGAAQTSATSLHTCATHPQGNLKRGALTVEIAVRRGWP